MFHMLKYKEELEKAGFTEQQAHTSLKIWMEFMDSNFATKTDLKESELNLRNDFSELRNEIAEFKNEFNTFKAETNYNFKSLESKLFLKLGALQVASIAFIASIISIMK